MASAIYSTAPYLGPGKRVKCNPLADSAYLLPSNWTVCWWICGREPKARMAFQLLAHVYILGGFLLFWIHRHARNSAPSKQALNLRALMSCRLQYGPVLLRRRAKRLFKESGGTVYYVSKYDLLRSASWKDIMRVNMSRPFSSPSSHRSHFHAVTALILDRLFQGSCSLNQ